MEDNKGRLYNVMHFSLTKHLLLKEMNTGNKKTKMEKKRSSGVTLYIEKAATSTLLQVYTIKHGINITHRKIY